MIDRAQAPFDRDARLLAAQARAFAAVLIAASVAFAFGPGAGLYALAVGGLIAGAGWVQARLEIQPARLAVIAGEMALLTGALVLSPTTLGHPTTPPGMLFFSPAVLALVLLIGFNASSIRPLNTWWAGAWAITCWIAAGAAAISSPATLTKRQVVDDTFPTLMAYLRAVTQPRYFDTDVWVFQLCVLAGATVILAVGAQRLRSLAAKAARRQTERNSLASHFAEAVAERLLADGLARPSSDAVAVLDCDLVGFTRLANGMAPAAVSEALKAYHAVVEAEVFASGGAVLKYVGDGVVAVFGLTSSEPAAGQALACGRRLALAWAAQGPGAFAPLAAPAIAIGVDFGEAVTGLVGEGRSMSLVVTGPPVEGAARLQGLRPAGYAAVCSTAAARAAGAEFAPGQNLVALSQDAFGLTVEGPSVDARG